MHSTNLCHPTHGEGAKNVEPGQGKGAYGRILAYATHLILVVSMRIGTDRLKAEKRQNIRSREQGGEIDAYEISASTEGAKGMHIT